MAAQLSSEHVALLANFLRNWQARQAERALADARMKAAFGEQASGNAEEMIGFQTSVTHEHPAG